MALPVAESLHVQQLLELLAVVTSLPDEESAVQGAAERAAQALEAEVGAVLFGDRVGAAIGFPAGTVPVADLRAVADGGRDWLDVPGLDRCRAFAAGWGGTHPGHLIIARWDEAPFAAEERGLIRGMARLLELTLTTLRTLRAEQAMRERSELQAVENARLAESLREQQRLLIHVSDIQRAISRRDPLQQILETITVAAADLFGDDVVGLWVRDRDDPDRARLLSAVGLPTAHLPAMPLDATGAVGEAMRQGDVVLVAGYGHASPAIRDLTGDRLCASMAAPVHENGAVVGGLLVASYEPLRSYTLHDQQKLGAFAQNVSLALTDAHTLDKVNRAARDTLTGLAGRGPFLEQLTEHLAAGRPAALLFIDLDRFKPINDTFGHAAGDHLLVTTAARIRAELRDADLAGRLGGDEFAVMLRGVTKLDEAIGVAQRMVRRIGRPVDLTGHTGHTVTVDASIGIALSSDARDATELMHHADVTMYDAKRRGRGGYQVFSRQLLDATDARLFKPFEA
ncbi:diguanylate cyclase domain-containing protein [Dactylosporangium siamense]|uniref:GGDEF domain-containing protein n=1 Tax=Dactylosporangium siamense TaxID=685454 RepID=A0A919PKS2_9ACTN|nr:sensor domain-containing diguanylate cyclase [Dactylosporangium siamense]GIG45036.1 hypothetical protein Dsi01nite_030770 [Dactylosporangium siamense]